MFGSIKFSMIRLQSLVVGLSLFQFESNNILRAGFKWVSERGGVSWPEKSETSHIFRDLYDCKHYNKSEIFPHYYKSNFHAYQNCNTNPVAAKEARSASEAIFLHHLPGKAAKDSAHWVRSTFTHKMDFSECSRVYACPRCVVDGGCGVGISTSYLKSVFPTSFLLGLDLSPFYLNEVGAEVESGSTYFMHRNIESTHILQDSVDIVSISYVLHELPLSALVRCLREAYRILRPGGTLAVLDMTPTLQASSWMMQMIFDRTEPYLDDYKKFCDARSEILTLIGFKNVVVDNSLPKTNMFFGHK